jgi:hypothetical protein
MKCSYCGYYDAIGGCSICNAPLCSTCGPHCYAACGSEQIDVEANTSYSIKAEGVKIE